MPSKDSFPPQHEKQHSHLQQGFTDSLEATNLREHLQTVPALEDRGERAQIQLSVTLWLRSDALPESF